MRNLFLLRGCPASGKSTWVKENNLEPYTLSTDKIRTLVESPVTNLTGEKYISQANDKEAWDLLFKLLEDKMSRGEFIVVDATHYKSSLISKYKDLVAKYRYRVNVVDFSGIPEEELLRRNSNREQYKKVPEETIKKMYTVIKDMSEVKKAFKIISPEEASKVVNSPLEPVQITNKEKVVIFGDIHGCYEPLKEYFDKNPFRDDYCYIFLGDYLDRGIQNKEVLEFLLSIYNKPNVFLLEGNHEMWLRIWSSKNYKEVAKEEDEYQDFYVSKIREQLKFKQAQIEKKIKENNRVLDDIKHYGQNENSDTIFYEFEEINIPEKTKELHIQNREYEKQLEDLKYFMQMLEFSSTTTKKWVTDILEAYKSKFGETLSLNPRNQIVKKLNMQEAKTNNGLRSIEFKYNTIPQIKDIDKTQIRRLCDKFIQMSYFTFGDNTYVCTHAGIPCLPDIKMSTEEMIKGIGKYEDADEIDKNFCSNTSDNYFSIHGHRNIMKSKVWSTSRTCNLEGQIESGGHLRIIEIGKDNSIQTLEIKNNVFKKIENVECPLELTDLEILKGMLHNKFIQVKHLDNNIISLNFTREAFERRKWDDFTCTARGLFVDKTNGNVVARSFNKFFNHNQVDQTKTPALKETFKFPVYGYKKENGFLGIIAKYNDEIHFFTKSTDKGDYVNWFIGALCDNYGIVLEDAYGDGSNRDMSYSEHYNQLNEYSGFDDDILRLLRRQLVDRLSPLLKEGYSYVFECCDPDNDPHIIKYDSPEVYLLQVFKNQLTEKHVDYEALVDIATRLNVFVKERPLVFNTWEEFEAWKDKFTKDITQWSCQHEGYVLEDSNGFQVKFKSSFYKYWRQMRAIKEALQSGRTNRKIYKTKEEIQVVKLMEEIPREKLKEMSIIDIEDLFYSKYNT